MKLKSVQAGDPVLRKVSQPLSADEINSDSIDFFTEVIRLDEH